MNNLLLKIFIWAGVAFILVFAPIARGAVAVWSITPILIISGLLVFVWLFAVNNDPKFYPPQRQILDIPILLYIGLALASLAFSIYLNASLQAIFRLFTYAGLYYLILNTFTFGMFRKMLAVVIGLGACLSAYGILQHFGLFSHSWWTPKEFLAATYVNHNHFSGLLELIIPLAFATAVEFQKRAPALAALSWTAFSIMVSAFLLSQSRGAYICLAISIFIMSVIMLRRQLIKTTSVIAVAVLITCGITAVYFAKPETFKRLDLVTQMNEGEASIKARLQIWQGTLEMIKEKPWTGAGIGTFQWGFTRFRPEGLVAIANSAHNDYLQAASEIGIFSIPLLLWMGLSLLWNGIVKKPYDVQALGCMTGLISLAFHGLIDFNFHIPANMLMCVLFAAYSGR